MPCDLVIALSASILQCCVNVQTFLAWFYLARQIHHVTFT